MEAIYGQPAFTVVDSDDARLTPRRFANRGDGAPRCIGLSSDARWACPGARRMEPCRPPCQQSSVVDRQAEEGWPALPECDGDRAGWPADPGGGSRRKPGRTVRARVVAARGGESARGSYVLRTSPPRSFMLRAVPAALFAAAAVVVVASSSISDAATAST